MKRLLIISFKPIKRIIYFIFGLILFVLVGLGMWIFHPVECFRATIVHIKEDFLG